MKMKMQVKKNYFQKNIFCKYAVKFHGFGTIKNITLDVFFPVFIKF